MAEEDPQRLALIARHQNVRWTYADLLGRSEDLAIELWSLGLQKGDRIGIWSANNREWGCWRSSARRLPDSSFRTNSTTR